MGRGAEPGAVAHTLARAAAACASPRARSGPDPVGDALEAVVDQTPPGPLRAALVGDLAERRPDLVLRRAAAWLGDGDVEVLARLPHHWFRVAVAGALRPWSDASIAAAAAVLAPHDGAGVVLGVMADRAPELTRPTGVDGPPHERWHAIGGEIWEWSLWRSDRGRHALEVVVSRGHADFTVGGSVEDALVEAWRNEGPAALDGAVAGLRAGAGAPPGRPPP
jgi:hypothetical protein